MSTVSRRAFGKFLQEARLQAGKSALAAGVHIETSKQTLLRMEDGIPTKIATPQFELLLAFYGASDEVREEALALWAEIREEDKAARAQGNSRGFWKAYSDQVAPHFKKFLRLEGVADKIFAYQPVIIPGLLQTQEYRRALIRIDDPAISAVNTERLLELTAKRQQRLNEANFQLEAVLSEAVLLHNPCGHAAMLDQLRWLVDVGERPNVSIRVVPFSAGPHRGLTIQTFTLLQLPSSSGIVLPPMVYAEGAVGSVFHEQDDEVGIYAQAIEGLRAVALTEARTRDLVSRIAKEHTA